MTGLLFPIFTLIFPNVPTHDIIDPGRSLMFTNTLFCECNSQYHLTAGVLPGGGQKLESINRDLLYVVLGYLLF